MPPAAPEPSRWFEAEIRPHEVALRAYLQTRFGGWGEVDDILQETYIRLCRARAASAIQCPKGLLFTTARNVALDSLRRRRARPVEPWSTSITARIPADDTDVAESVSRRQELECLAEAVAALPPQCREVMLRRFRHGATGREIAEQLGLSPETVKVHLARGMRRCAEYFAERGLLKGRQVTRVAS
jgi:RNA polymerase sigma-70 factor (ECF subfamily)